jgi:hypothetical protein
MEKTEFLNIEACPPNDIMQFTILPDRKRHAGSNRRGISAVSGIDHGAARPHFDQVA